MQGNRPIVTACRLSPKRAREVAGEANVPEPDQSWQHKTSLIKARPGAYISRGTHLLRHSAAPHICSADEIAALMQAAALLKPVGSIRSLMDETLFGLIAAMACASEALSLNSMT